MSQYITEKTITLKVKTNLNQLLKLKTNEYFRFHPWMVDIEPSLEVQVLGKTYDISKLHQKPVVYFQSSLFQEEKIKRIKTSSDFSTP